MLWIALVPLFLIGVAVAVVPVILGMILQERDVRRASEVAPVVPVPHRPRLDRSGDLPAELAA